MTHLSLLLPFLSLVSSSEIHWTDVDGDSRPDILLQEGGSLRLLLNDGSGRFEQASTRYSLPSLEGIGVLAIAELEHAPILAVGTASGLRVLRVDRDQLAWSEVTDLAGRIEPGAVDALAWIDLDGDGADDLHVHGAGGDLLLRYGNDGLFEEVLLPAAIPGGEAATSSEVALTERRISGPAEAGASRDLGHSRHDRDKGTRGAPGPSIDTTVDRRARDGGSRVSPPSKSAGDSSSASTGSSLGASTTPATPASPVSPLLACAGSVEDQVTGACLFASSIPTLGMLYPLSAELFVDAVSGFVGIGTTIPSHPLEVDGAILSGTGNSLGGTDSAIGGGANNQVTGSYATIGGGGGALLTDGNEASGVAATVGGGERNVASGNQSAIAGGEGNNATARHTSIGGGLGNLALGAQAMIPGGTLNIAAGESALAAGTRAQAVHDGAFVWGDSTDETFASTAPDQFLVRAGGGVGIGTDAPTAGLDVVDPGIGKAARFDGRVEVVGTDALRVDADLGFAATGETGSEPRIAVEGPGVRMIWTPARAAFRGGRVSGLQWDWDQVGGFSFGFGDSPLSTGQASIAMGDRPEASGYAGVALGYLVTASEFASVAMGDRSLASGNSSTAIGRECEASGFASVALGAGAHALGTDSIALGNASASGFRSFASGFSSEASGDGSVAIGRSVKVDADHAAAVGRYNLGGGTPGFKLDTDPIFEIGNGIGSSSRSNALAVLRNGSVGIGTQQNPLTARLEVLQDSSTEHGLLVAMSGQNAGRGVSVVHPDPSGIGIFSNTTSTSGANRAITGSTSSPDGHAGWFQNIAGGDAAYFIGDIEVEGEIVSKGVLNHGIRIDNPNNSNASVRFDWLDDVARVRWGGNGAGALGGFDFQRTGDASLMRILDNGRVGIGTTTPAERLDVAGNVRCVSLIQTSDARYKRDVEELDGALETALSLRGVSYHWDQERFPQGGEERQFGFLAQDVREVLPEAVREDADGMLAVSYTSIVPVLVEALREQQATIEFLEANDEVKQARIEKLGSSLGGQQATIAELRADLDRALALLEAEAAPAR